MEGRRDAARDSDAIGGAFFPFALQSNCMGSATPVKDALRHA